jgi:hypothetical protein
MKRRKGTFVQYWQRPFYESKYNQLELSSTTKLILTSILSSFAAIFQSAAGFVPGIGFFVSAMTTLPIFLSTYVSIKHGFLSYFVSILLLLMIQPSELIIFSFTTGILGLVLGISFSKTKTRFLVVFLSGAALFIGILTILLVFRFPVLGPSVGTALHLHLLFLKAFFSFLYSWMAAVVCSFLLSRLAHLFRLR